MLELLNEKPPPSTPKRTAIPAQPAVDETETPQPRAEPMNWTSPAIMAALVVLALWLLSLWIRG